MTQSAAKRFWSFSTLPANSLQPAEVSAARWDAEIDFAKRFDGSGQLPPESKLENYRNALAMLEEGVCLFGSDFRVIFCNRHYLAIYNLKVDDVEYGISLEEVFQKRKLAGTLLLDSIASHQEFFNAMKSTPEEKSIKGRLADGRIIAVRGKALPNGSFITIHSDVTNKEYENIAVQTMMDQIPGYMWVKDTKSRFVIANKNMASDFGYAHSSEMVGKNDTDVHGAELAKGFLKIEENIMRTRKPSHDMEELVFDSTGAKKWMLTTKVPVANAYDELFGLVGISYDITERKKAENFTQGNSNILQMIMTGSPLSTVMEALTQLIEQRVVGVQASVLRLQRDGIHVRQIAGLRIPEPYRRALKQVQIGPKVGSCGTAMFRKEAVHVSDIETDPLWEDFLSLTNIFAFRSCWSNPILSKRGDVLGSFALYSNAVRLPTEVENDAIRRAAQIAAVAIEFSEDEKRINFLATHDYLTGLPNRVLLNDRINNAYQVAKRANTAFSVAFIDLDNFKIINDSIDHKSGDAVLKIVAERIKKCMRRSDTVARFGGDEFVIVFQDRSKDLELLMQMLKRIQISLAEPIGIAEREFNITASMGIANYPEDCLSPDDIISSADSAMYKAKESGGNTFQFYSRELNAEFHNKLQLREELRLALARNELTLVYQPQVDLHSGRIFAVETLMRWKHPKRGYISPAI